MRTGERSVSVPLPLLGSFALCVSIACGCSFGPESHNPADESSGGANADGEPVLGGSDDAGSPAADRCDAFDCGLMGKDGAECGRCTGSEYCGGGGVPGRCGAGGGAREWNDRRTVWSASHSFEPRVAIDGDGSAVVGVNYYAPIDLGLGALPQRDLEAGHVWPAVSPSIGSDTDIAIALFNADGVTEWAQSFGSDPTPELGVSDWVHAVLPRKDGGTLVVGSTSGSKFDLGLGNVASDESGDLFLYLAVVDADGSVSASRSYPGVVSCGMSCFPEVVAVNRGDGNVVVLSRPAGVFDVGLGRMGREWVEGGPDIVMTTFTSDGDAIAVHWIPASVYAMQLTMAASPDGFAISGTTSVRKEDLHRLDFGGGPLDEFLPVSEIDERLQAAKFVVRYNAAGEHQWTQLYPGFQTSVGDHNSQLLAMDAASNLIVGGMFAGSVDLKGETVVGPPLAADSTHTLYPDDAYALVVKLDRQGRYLWSRSYGPNKGAADVTAVAVDPSGNVVVAGAFGGAVDFGDGDVVDPASGTSAYVIKLDPDGKLLWKHIFSVDGAESTRTINAIDIGDDGSVGIVGLTSGPPDSADVPRDELFVEKLAP